MKEEKGALSKSASAVPRRGLGWIVLAAVLIALPFLLQNEIYYLDVLIFFLLWAAMAGAWNLAGGYGGLLSLGHALFFGVGAYTSSLLFVKLHISPWIGMLAGAVAAAILGAFIGVLTLRLKGPFFGLATIAFSEVFMIIAINWKDLTQGSQGINIPYTPGLANMVFDSKIPYYFIALALCALPYFTAKWLERSKFGYRLIAVRGGEAAAQALGINTVAVKVTILVISSALTAMAGTLYAQYIAIIEPLHEFSFALSVQMVLMSMIGGTGTASGPVFGALVVTFLNTVLRDVLEGAQGGLQAVVYGALLVLVVLFIPEGVIPWAKRQWRRLAGRVAS
ncbi:MAG: branched-chain amino acid ABC transporter permease [Alicyclobacillaceae bacterium]|nr:branched-chain amino acid ABC transporter permease [Alicyclobacillaceae bacterium]